MFVYITFAQWVKALKYDSQIHAFTLTGMIILTC